MADTNQEQTEAFNKAWSKVVAKAWSDPAFKQRLLKEPNKVLKENGIAVPAGIECKVSENSDKVVHLNLPKKPAAELEEAALKKIAAGIELGQATEHYLSTLSSFKAQL